MTSPASASAAVKVPAQAPDPFLPLRAITRSAARALRAAVARCEAATGLPAHVSLEWVENSTSQAAAPGGTTTAVTDYYHFGRLTVAPAVAIKSDAYGLAAVSTISMHDAVAVSESDFAASSAFRAVSKISHSSCNACPGQSGSEATSTTGAQALPTPTYFMVHQPRESGRLSATPPPPPPQSAVTAWMPLPTEFPAPIRFAETADEVIQDIADAAVRRARATGRPLMTPMEEGILIDAAGACLERYGVEQIARVQQQVRNKKFPGR